MTPDNATPERMTPDSVAAILRQHNAWRRDVHDESDQPLEMQSPKLVGEAIDVAVAYLVALDEPTQSMIVAGFECDAWDKLSDAVLEKKGWPFTCRDAAECVTAIYKAMRAAAMEDRA